MVFLSHLIPSNYHSISVDSFSTAPFGFLLSHAALCYSTFLLEDNSFFRVRKTLALWSGPCCWIYCRQHVLLSLLKSCKFCVFHGHLQENKDIFLHIVQLHQHLPSMSSMYLLVFYLRKRDIEWNLKFCICRGLVLCSKYSHDLMSYSLSTVKWLVLILKFFWFLCWVELSFLGPYFSFHDMYK